MITLCWSNLGLRNKVVFILAVERWTSSLSSEEYFSMFGCLSRQCTCGLWTWRRYLTAYGDWSQVLEGCHSQSLIAAFCR